MKKFALLMGALLFSGNLYAVDTVFVEYGSGNTSDMARVGTGWDWDKQWFADGDWLVTGSWEAALGSWHGRSASGGNVTDIGVTPVFRLQQKQPSGVAPYFEGAIGLHLISPAAINGNRNFGSSFQFGDHLGVGVRFGERRQFDLAYRYQHLSNGGIKRPNNGINFSQIRFAYHF